MATATKPAVKPWLSGWCNPSNPPTSHERCGLHPRSDGVPCACACHHPEAEPSELPDPYEDLVERVAHRYATATFSGTDWDDLHQRSRVYSRAIAQQAVDLVTAELRTWEP